MATGNGGSKGRLVVLVVLLAAVAVAGWYRFGRGAGGGIEEAIVSSELVGKTLDDATKAFGVQPVEQPNPDAATNTAKIYLYTLAGAKPDRQFIRVRVASTGKILNTRFIDASGNDIVIDRPQ